MIKEAIMALDGNGKAGSSPYAIAKYMGEQHMGVLPANYRKVLAVQLRNFAAKGRLVKVKASFKLSAAYDKKATAAKAARSKAAKGVFGGAKRKKTPRPSAAAAKKPASSAEAKKAVPPARPARAKRARKPPPRSDAGAQIHPLRHLQEGQQGSA
uniref:Water stress inducible protein n=1 Tax=Oryza sativa subsp. indica TaxID=39946 RepID=O24227_ORYSI|nr:water stress inducible protein [Oryza sativa Indica Group]